MLPVLVASRNTHDRLYTVENKKLKHRRGFRGTFCLAFGWSISCPNWGGRPHLYHNGQQTNSVSVIVCEVSIVDPQLLSWSQFEQQKPLKQKKVTQHGYVIDKRIVSSPW
jgi:hypothetical protein